MDEVFLLNVSRMADQLWEQMHDKYTRDLGRIAADGIRDDRDALIARQCCALVLAELYDREIRVRDSAG